MADPWAVEPVLSRYPNVRVRRIEPLGGAGGFSGATFWRIETDVGPLCLRRWPREHPTRSQLQAIHDVLCHVADQGFAKLPVPHRSLDGSTFESAAGHLWELSDWLPGVADFHEKPSGERLDNAMHALALFHRSSATLQLTSGVPTGLLNRRDQLERLRVQRLSDSSRCVSECGWPEFRQRAAAILHCFGERVARTEALLCGLVDTRVLLQPCIRDIWHDHVLFDGDDVSGFVDFGAMRTDHVACDISRLLGSLVGSERAKWEQGIATYQSIRPLSANELTLVDAYDRSTVLLSGMNWVQWVAVEGRQFEDHQRVLNRMDEILLRLQQM